MGRGLLLTYLQLPDEGDPDYAAGHTAVGQLTIDAIELDWNLGQAVSTELEDAGPPAGAAGDWPSEQDFLVAAKRRLHRRIDELRVAYGDEEASGEWMVFELFGHRLLVTGGWGSGDSPCELYDIIDELSDCPAVLRAMGCDLDVGA